MIDDYSPFMIDGLSDQGAMSVVFGASNAGKTFVLMDRFIASRWGINGARNTAQSTVIYVAAEGGRRISSASRRCRKSTKDENFQLVRYPIDLCTNDVDLDKLTHLVLEALREQEAPTWVIVDTLARALAGR
jgi:RecA-family ATPase